MTNDTPSEYFTPATYISKMTSSLFIMTLSPMAFIYTILKTELLVAFLAGDPPFLSVLGAIPGIVSAYAITEKTKKTFTGSCSGSKSCGRRY